MLREVFDDLKGIRPPYKYTQECNLRSIGPNHAYILTLL
jgi:hypothetical protein